MYPQLPPTPESTPPKAYPSWKEKGKEAERTSSTPASSIPASSSLASSSIETDEEATSSTPRIALTDLFQHYRYPIMMYHARSTVLTQQPEGRVQALIREHTSHNRQERDQGQSIHGPPLATSSSSSSSSSSAGAGSDSGSTSTSTFTFTSTDGLSSLLSIVSVGVLVSLVCFLAFKALTCTPWASDPTTTPICSARSTGNPFAHLLQLPTVDFAAHQLIEPAFTVNPTNQSHSRSSSSFPSRSTTFSAINESLASLTLYTNTLHNLSSLPCSHSDVQDALQASHRLTDTLLSSAALPSLLAAHRDRFQNYASLLARATARAAAADMSSTMELTIKLLGWVDSLGLSWVRDRDQVRKEWEQARRANDGLQSENRGLEQLLGRVRCFHGKVEERLGIGGKEGGRSIRRLSQRWLTDGGGWWTDIVQECGVDVLDLQS